MPHSGAALTVSLSALRENYRLLKARHARQTVAAVVKADAYGLGVAAVAQALWEEGCHDFFVATLEEGIELRQHLSQAQIAVFYGLGRGEEREFQEHHLTPVLNTPEQAKRFADCHELSAAGRAILHIDTGMTRLGFSETELQTHRATLQSFHPALVMSHLACANDPEHPKNAEQLARFKAALALFPSARASFCNSSGLFLAPEFHFDIGRPGCALYGIAPVQGENPMRHVATLSAPFVQVRTLDRDETVGYGATHRAKKGSRIAIVKFGYADGMLRCLSNIGTAYVAGTRVSFAGRVSMDMVALDVSSIPERKLAADTRAEFINDRQTVSDVAAAANTIGYEIFTRIGKRVKRVYG